MPNQLTAIEEDLVSDNIPPLILDGNISYEFSSILLANHIAYGIETSIYTAYLEQSSWQAISSSQKCAVDSNFPTSCGQFVRASALIADQVCQIIFAL